MKNVGWIILGMLLIIVISGLLYYFVHPMFGGSFKGARLERMKQSPNFRDGVFHNLEVTPSLKNDVNIVSLMWDFLFNKKPGLKPLVVLPAVKCDLKNLPAQDLLVWFGHSSYLLKIDGKLLLVDPVFSENASPVPGSNKAFKIAVDYTAADFPEIDFLFISHDHYDHLDYETVTKLREKVGRVICGLGVGAHFESWGYKPEQIVEGDWYDQVTLQPDFQVTFTPARHFSGRRFTRNNTLWTSFVLKTTKYNLFLGGDSGYGKHFKTIGDRFGPFDLAILENGQYNDAWHYIHSLPEEWGLETRDLQAKVTLPVHSSKFALAMHGWKEPMEKFYEIAQKENSKLITPKIGELVHLDKLDTIYAPWWREVN
ncbi:MULTISPECIES: MBL fold metallo-hydrolase [Sphingobacterium]|uniref:MBL fold metallo-hydrolase n=1 Tax=Sphingobacterium athyrii TaxID=2152717 RepID=A0A363NRC2_9SPHI|nr:MULTISPECIES: MBL fold metallo-hydrolase [Sphingobacterium]PUV23260.1 MBL fold metallo-hydrolase [Sphingobacterium athyrii]QIH36710.1 MBL fold metallo-hydrolase [Sphingobacterium sp. DR205]